MDRRPNADDARPSERRLTEGGGGHAERRCAAADGLHGRRVAAGADEEDQGGVDPPCWNGVEERVANDAGSPARGAARGVGARPSRKVAGAAVAPFRRPADPFDPSDPGGTATPPGPACAEISCWVLRRRLSAGPKRESGLIAAGKAFGDRNCEPESGRRTESGADRGGNGLGRGLQAPSSLATGGKDA